MISGKSRRQALVAGLALSCAFLFAAPAQAGSGAGSRVEAGSPITATYDTWTWVDFPDSKCANGSATGIGINIHQNSDKLIIFFEGGGACWDYQSCYVTGMATYISSGYTKKDFDATKPYSKVPLFERNEPRNPYVSASYVYVPYCTGDVHSGSKMTPLTGNGVTKNTYFNGYNNVTAYLNRVVPTFPALKRVLVSGWSAGGFGAAFNWEHIQNAFPTVRTDVLDDSGPPFEPNGDRWTTWQSTWGIPIPAGCPECMTDPGYFIDYYGDKYDGTHRFGLLSYTNDSVISTYYGMTRRQFHRNLYDLAYTSFDPLTSVKYFFVDGSSHVMLSWDQVGYNGAKLSDWINQFASDDPKWTSIAPPE